MARRKPTKEEKAEWLAELRRMLPPGATVHTVLRHVARSGMMRAIDCYLVGGDGDPSWLSYRVAAVTGFAFSEKYEAIRADGCGMDMGFHIVSTLSRVLYPDGFGCIGERCPSNDHSNGDRDYTPHDPRSGAGNGRAMPDQSLPYHWHRSGDYALRHRWL